MAYWEMLYEKIYDIIMLEDTWHHHHALKYIIPNITSPDLLSRWWWWWWWWWCCCCCWWWWFTKLWSMDSSKASISCGTSRPYHVWIACWSSGMKIQMILSGKVSTTCLASKRKCCSALAMSCMPYCQC